MGSLAGESVVVVGAGFGGLSTACYLADAGASVTVLERNGQLGGRASTLEREGFRFDMGPSWYLMPDVFERFFGHFGRDPGEFYDLERLDPHYRIFFKDGDRVDVPADRLAARRLFERYESGAGRTLDRYLERCAMNYEVAMEEFVYEDRTSLRDFLDPAVARNARGLALVGSMERHVSRYFEHPKLQQILQYSLVFLGGSPQNTPALYNLMSHVDFGLGVWYPDGGMASVVDAVVSVGESLGVTYRTDTAVTGLEGRTGAVSVETTDGAMNADRVVSGAGYPHTELQLLSERDRGFDVDYWRTRTYAPSACLCYLGIEGDLPELAHHTLVLPTDWDPHFGSIFERPRWPRDPAYYCCVPSRTDPTVAPDGHEALFVLVPVAAGLDDSGDQVERFRDQILADLERHTGVSLRERIVLEERFCVSDFATRYNAYRGTALGLAHTVRQTALFRPPRRARGADWLYYTGADTTPGIGVPMCLISGEHTADAIVEDVAGGDRW